MTITGILAGVTNPYGAGFALSRVAARLRPTDAPAAQAAQNADAAQSAAAAQQPQDQVELSDAARAQPQLTQQQQDKVDELKQRDADVRQHEAAHEAAAGGYAVGAPHFEYTTGPDGRRYVTNGEVNIDTSPVQGDPDATIRKMETVKAAALAPADPSGQDRRVAAEAMAAIQQAQAERASQSRTPAGDAGQRPQPAAPMLQLPQSTSRPAAPNAYSPGRAASSPPAQLLDVRA